MILHPLGRQPDVGDDVIGWYRAVGAGARSGRGEQM
jgi:hypothetical protein